MTPLLISTSPNVQTTWTEQQATPAATELLGVSRADATHVSDPSTLDLEFLPLQLVHRKLGRSLNRTQLRHSSRCLLISC